MGFWQTESGRSSAADTLMGKETPGKMLGSLGKAKQPLCLCSVGTERQIWDLGSRESEANKATHTVFHWLCLKLIVAAVIFHVGQQKKKKQAWKQFCIWSYLCLRSFHLFCLFLLLLCLKLYNRLLENWSTFQPQNCKYEFNI